MFNFQKAAKSARSKYFSDLINTHSHRPRILFSTINSIINPGCQFHVEPSTERCECFLQIFSEKVLAIHSSFTLQSSDLSLFSLAGPASFSCFQNVSLRELCDLVNKMKKTASSLDVIPSKIIKASFSEIGTSIQSLINLSLNAGLVRNVLSML